MGGSLAISARKQDRLAIVDFADTGEGIAEKDLTNIFNPWIQRSNQRPGLGLTICQRIMEQHRGKIRVQQPRLQGHEIFAGVPHSMRATKYHSNDLPKICIGRR